MSLYRSIIQEQQQCINKTRFNHFFFFFFWQIVLLHSSPKYITISRSHHLLECPLSITVKNVSHSAVQNWAVEFKCISSSTLKMHFIFWMKILMLIVHGRDHSLPLLCMLTPSATFLFMWVYWFSETQLFPIIIWLKINTGINEWERDRCVPVSVRYHIRE